MRRCCRHGRLETIIVTLAGMLLAELSSVKRTAVPAFFFEGFNVPETDCCTRCARRGCGEVPLVGQEGWGRGVKNEHVRFS